jgi:hypothetical protein
MMCHLCLRERERETEPFVRRLGFLFHVTRGVPPPHLRVDKSWARTRAIHDFRGFNNHFLYLFWHLQTLFLTYKKVLWLDRRILSFAASPRARRSNR